MFAKLVAAEEPRQLIDCFKTLYPDCQAVLRDLPSIITFLQTKAAETLTPSGLTIHVSPARVWGTSGEDDKPLALGFTPWCQWLVAPVVTHDEVIQPTHIVVHCLYEMTYYGPDDEYQKWRGCRTGQKGRNLIRVV